MKRTICIAMALALTACLFVGCGCQNVSERVDGMITDATEMLPHVTTDPTRDTSRPTVPHTETTRPTDDTRPTTDFSKAPENVNGGTNGWMKDETTEPSTDPAPTDTARSRNRMDGRS